jgi:hypothetical protein
MRRHRISEGQPPYWPDSVRALAGGGGVDIGKERRTIVIEPIEEPEAAPPPIPPPEPEPARTG